MKMKDTIKKDELFEAILPLDAASPLEELFDDCPLCQELKRQIKAGQIERVAIHVPVGGEE